MSINPTFDVGPGWGKGFDGGGVGFEVGFELGLMAMVESSPRLAPTLPERPRHK